MSAKFVILFDVWCILILSYLNISYSSLISFQLIKFEKKTKRTLTRLGNLRHSLKLKWVFLLLTLVKPHSKHKYIHIYIHTEYVCSLAFRSWGNKVLSPGRLEMLAKWTHFVRALPSMFNERAGTSWSKVEPPETS